jgi:site-specific recombinase XerD
LSYSDLWALTPDDVHVGIDGDKWITIYRQKTLGRSSIPLLPRAEEIVNSYADDTLCLRKNKLLPVPSNQKMNEYLKEISNICSINKKITTHTARHTFATTITLTNGVPIESVSKILGHKSLKTTQIYSKVVDLKVAEDMKKLKVRMQPHSSHPNKKSNS